MVKRKERESQIKRLKKRVKHLEYDIIDIRMKLPKPIEQPRQIGFTQLNNLQNENEFDETQE
jgi:hypothetical protein